MEEKSFSQRIEAIVEITKKIVEKLDFLEEVEKSGSFKKNEILPLVEELKSLLSKESKYYEDIYIHDDFSDAFYDVRFGIRKFKLKYGLSEEMLDRITYSILSLPAKNTRGTYYKKFNYNILDEFPEYINLKFPEYVPNHVLVFDAIKEELFKKYFKSINMKINSKDYKNLSAKLISFKYSLLRKYPTTNKVLIETFIKRNRISRLQKLDNAEGVDLAAHNETKRQYVYKFFEKFLIDSLLIEDSSFNDEKKLFEIANKLIVAEAMFTILKSDDLEVIANIFYKYCFKFSRIKEDLNNKKIGNIVEELINKSTLEKRR